jgi:hypothetical protein
MWSGVIFSPLTMIISPGAAGQKGVSHQVRGDASITGAA